MIIVLALWEFVWYKQWVSPLFFSGPSAIAKQFWFLLTNGSLRSDILFSGKNFVLGLSAATVTGVVFGVLIGWYRRMRMIFDPFLNALYATPRIAMVPLIIIWFGIDWKSKVFIVFMSSFFPILVNTVAGVRSLDSGSASRGSRVLRFGLANLQDDRYSRFRAVHPDGHPPGRRSGLDRCRCRRNVRRQ